MNISGKCIVGRTLTRNDRYAGVDWHEPCHHPVSKALNVTHNDGEQVLMPMCLCHWQIVTDQLDQGK